MTTIEVALISQDGEALCLTVVNSSAHDAVLAGILDAARGALIAAGFSATHWDEFEWPQPPDRSGRAAP